MSKRKFLQTPNATEITKCPKRFPNVVSVLGTLVEGTEIDVKQVGKSFEYSADVVKNNYYAAQGIFMDYFIRKHLSNQFNIEITDTRNERIIENPESYDIEDDDHAVMIENYEIFKDPKTKAMDIIENIHKVAHVHKIWFREKVPNKFSVDEENLREVIKYFESMPYTAVDLNPTLGCEYFRADGDLIFDNEVLYDIKNSKFKSLERNLSAMPLRAFFQHIIYSFGFYKKTGKMITKFKTYNPLLGFEHSLELKSIDYDLFEEALTKDLEAYGAFLEGLRAKLRKD